MIAKGQRPGLFVSNSRFYILLIAFILSVLVACYLRTAIASTALYMIRVQQIYGFTALFFWYLALLATPLSSIFGREGTMKQYLYARRALGVSAAYFALLHMLAGLYGQIGGLGNILLLPARFQQAVLMGSIALLFLLLMAATSFDSITRILTFPRWKWLHRCGYTAAILVFLHVWMIGTHTAYAWVRWGFFCLLVFLAGLESYRAATNLRRRLKETGNLLLAFFFVTFFAWSVAAIAYLPRLVDGHHETHTGAGSRH